MTRRPGTGEQTQMEFQPFSWGLLLSGSNVGVFVHLLGGN